MANAPRGRPRKYAEYEALVRELPKPMTKRPRYLNGVGVFRGARGDTAWIKIKLPKGGTYRGKNYAPGDGLEIKLGRLASWSWEQLEAKRDDLQGRADRGEALEDQPTLGFEDWAKRWLAAAEKRIRGVETTQIHVNKHLIPFFGTKPIAQITTEDINRWITQQLGTSAPGTVKRQFNTLRAILNSAIKSGHIETSPCRHADPIRGAVARQRFLEGDEMVRLLAAAEEQADWLPDFIVWCIHSGMRKGEVRALKWSDIRALDDGRTFAMVKTSKNDQPRMVACTKTMTQILERQAARRVDGNDAVFPIAAMTLRRKWEKARTAAGLEDVTIHDLRRTHGTYAAAAGVDLRTLAGRIGHTDLTMLQKHYAAIVGTADIEAANTIERVFAGMTDKQQA